MSCPNCGHCPACGRSNMRPVQYWPYWGYGPHWGYPYTYGAPVVVPTTWGVGNPNVYGTTTGTFTVADVQTALRYTGPNLSATTSTKA
jgi:hypothetical protein